MGFTEEHDVRIGFPLQFIQYISTCITTATFSLNLNGQQVGFFKNTRGIRQGCPLSPFLFTIVMELLSTVLKQKLNRRLIQGFQFMHDNTPITHLMYADDLLIYGTCTRYETLEIRNSIGKFCDMTGQRINLEKSTITFSKSCSEEMKSEIKGILNIQNIDLEGKYLGTSIYKGKPLAKTYEKLIERTKKKLSSWKKVFLSHAGREVLIKASLASIPIYTMATNLIPKNVCRQLDNLHRDFWWGYENGTKHCYLTAWKYMQRDCQSGGLNIKSMETLNMAMLGKLAWKFINSTGILWVKALREKYVKGELDQINIQMLTEKGSPQWQTLFKYIHRLNDKCNWTLKDGKLVKIFEHNWMLGQKIVHTQNHGMEWKHKTVDSLLNQRKDGLVC